MGTGAQKRGASIDKDISALRRSIDPHGHLCFEKKH
jgi:hypothetical protein